MTKTSTSQRSQNHLPLHRQAPRIILVKIRGCDTAALAKCLLLGAEDTNNPEDIGAAVEMLLAGLTDGTITIDDDKMTVLLNKLYARAAAS